MNLRVEAFQVLRQLLLVARHRLPIDAWSRAALEAPKRALQGTPVNMMQ